jgi:hypothetical protein
VITGRSIGKAIPVLPRQIICIGRPGPRGNVQEEIGKFIEEAKSLYRVCHRAHLDWKRLFMD